MTKAFGTLHTHVCKVLAVHCQQMAIEQTLFSGLIITVLAVMQFGFRVLNDELVGAQRAGLVIAPRVLGIFWRSLTVVAQELVTLQMIVETDLFVGGKVAVGTLVLLLE